MANPFLTLVQSRSRQYHRELDMRSESKLDKIFAGGVPLDSVGAITSLLGEEYALLGGHAISIQGKIRTTTDIDLLVHPDHWPQVIQRLGGTGVTPLDSPRPDRSIAGISFMDKGGTTLDLIWIEWGQEALAEAESSKYGRVLSKPFLVLSKLWAARGELDDADAIGTLRNMTGEEIEKARSLIVRWLPSDTGDFDQMAAISRM